jgi:hypothetical protein
MTYSYFLKLLFNKIYTLYSVDSNLPDVFVTLVKLGSNIPLFLKDFNVSNALEGSTSLIVRAYKEIDDI